MRHWFWGQRVGAWRLYGYWRPPVFIGVSVAASRSKQKEEAA